MSKNDISQVLTEQLLPDVIHKIKNSLGGIGGFAALLERDLGSDHSCKRLVMRIEEGVRKINSIVIDLMILTRDLEKKPEPIKIAEFLCRLYDSEGVNGAWCKSKNIHMDSEQLTVIADKNILQKIFYYIAKYMTIMGGVDHIDIGAVHDDRVDFAFYFTNGSFDENFDKPLEYILSSDPIEARLSMAVILRLVELHGGGLSIAKQKDDFKSIVVSI